MAGLAKAAKELSSVDYEGMLPQGAGNYAGGANDGAFRMTAIYKPDPAGPTKASQVKDLFVGSTAQAYQLDRPCFEKL